MKEVLENIFTVNLGVKNWDRVLVFTDLIREDEKVGDDERSRREALRKVAQDVAEVGKKFCTTVHMEIPSVGSHGAEPPVELWEAAFGPHIIWHMKDRKVFDKIFLEFLLVAVTICFPLGLLFGKEPMFPKGST